MNDLLPFEFSGRKVRVVVRDGEPWFAAADVARCLGYRNPQEAIRDHCKGVSETLTPSEGGSQKTKIIREPDVYRLIFSSKLPAAEKFERWVCEEVLPAIRKTGGYRSGQPSILEMAQQIVEEHRRLTHAQEAVKLMQPRTPYGTPSEVNGQPRIALVPSHFRSRGKPETALQMLGHLAQLELGLALPEPA